MDEVICVSAAQADRVRRALVPGGRVVVIRNAIGDDAFAPPDPTYRARLLGLFRRPPRLVVGAAGRLSPEKNFALFIDAAARVAALRPDAGFVIFGEGPLRPALAEQINRRGLDGRCVLAGFQADLGKWLPHLDLAVLSSTTEGLPVALLESFAAGVPAVATAVGGIPEVLDDGRSGYLVRSGDANALVERIAELLRDDAKRAGMGEFGRRRVRSEFTFAEMSRKYHDVFARVARRVPAR
jgi:glycosyltransferase involved in cell wall biosynthesis